MVLVWIDRDVVIWQNYRNYFGFVFCAVCHVGREGINYILKE